MEVPRQERCGAERDEAIDGDDLFLVRLPNGVIAEVCAGHFAIARDGRAHLVPRDPRR